MVVDLDEVTFSYNEQETISQLSLTIAPGECLVVAGISGCGKTTLTRILNGLVPELFEGELTGKTEVLSFDTQTTDIYQLSTKVGSVFQNPKTQFFTVDVLSELAFPCENQGIPAEDIRVRIKNVAELFEIEDLLNREMFSLSGGEKQLVAFASAYIIQPELLVLDEPSSNLDFSAIEKIKRILAKVKALGCTIVIAEHRLYYLNELADRYLLVVDGRIKHQYTTAEFLALTASERQDLGLRTQDLQLIIPQPPLHLTGEQAESLTLDNLTFSYTKKGQPALQFSQTDFKAGDAIGIVGPNGAGKSTFAKVLTGLLKSSTGEIKLNGKGLNQRERIAQSFLVMQDVNYQLFCETVSAELLLKAGQPELLTEVVQALNLEDLLTRHPQSLSGGQKQRVAIASAILSGKKVIVLDEPTSGLDYYHMKQVSESINYLRSLNIFVFVISHDLEFLAMTCNQLLAISAGEKSGYYDLNAKDSPTLLSIFAQLFT